MPLPILKSAVSASNEDLVRFYHQIELEWGRHVAQEAALDCGTALVNGELKTVHDANRIFNAALAPGTGPAAAFEEVERHFSAGGAICHHWILSPSLPGDRTEALAAYLLGRGYVKTTVDILHLPRLPQTPVQMVGGLKIIPARASFRHFRTLAEEQAQRWSAPQLADAAMLHLDDPHYDALMAMKDGQAVGVAGVLAVGENGGIQDVFVSEKFRRQGIGRTLMARVLEVCVRSLFRHILLSVEASDAPAVGLYGSLGFAKVGEMVVYVAPGVRDVGQ